MIDCLQVASCPTGTLKLRLECDVFSLDNCLPCTNNGCCTGNVISSIN